MVTFKQIIQSLPIHPKAKVLEIDPITSLFALEKPISVKSHPNKPSLIDKEAILLAPYNLDAEHYTTTLTFFGEIQVHLLNRLDSPTSGVILLCIDPSLAIAIRQVFKERRVTKTYHAIVKSTPYPRTGIWRDKLASKNIGDKVRTQKSTGPLAETVYKLLFHNPDLNLSLLELTPKTGYTHQLRVQSALHHVPILGDKTYGDFNLNRQYEKSTAINRLFLHASAISFEYLLHGKKHSFLAKSLLPEEFTKFINK